MKQTITKFVFMNAMDQDHLAAFLNNQAASGWHPIKISSQRIKLAYQPDNKSHYTVLLRNQSLGYTSYSHEDERQADTLNPFGYQVAFKTAYFNIYASDHDQIFVTDVILSKQERRKTAKRELLMQSILLFTIMFNLYIQFKSPYHLLKSNVLILGVCVMTWATANALIHMIHDCRVLLDKPTRMSYRWKHQTSDFATLTFMTVWFVLMLLLASNLSSLKLIMIPVICGLALSLIYTQIQSFDVTKPIKYTILLLAFYLTFILSNRFLFNDIFSTTTHPDTITSESFILKETTQYAGADSITIVKIKVPFAKDTVRSLFYKSQHITTKILNNRKIRLTDSFGNTHYVYQSDAIIVLSDQQLSDAFYASLLNPHPEQSQ